LDSLNIKLYALTLDSKDPEALAKFYGELLGWMIPYQNEDFVVLAPPDSAQGAYPCITFQRNPAYVPPVWPEKPEAQQQMAHLDFAVNDLAAAVQHATRCGAAEAPRQFSDGWRVMLDPAGHPFCLCRMQPLFESPDFALR
jgi:predicted enzyme related to lactoylglutathione lyase